MASNRHLDDALAELAARSGLVAPRKREEASTSDPAPALTHFSIPFPTHEQLFSDSSRSEFNRKFIRDVRPGDLICARVVRISYAFLEVELLCTMSRFRRCLTNTFKGINYSIGYDRAKRLYQVNDRVLCTVNSSANSEKELSISLVEGEALLQKDQDDTDLPAYYREWTASSSTNQSAAVIERERNNPNLAEKLSIRIDSSISLIPSINGGKKCTESADELRLAQTRKLAMTHVAKGATLTREGKCFEAIQCFNRALNVDEQCADAYVGRGAACAGNKNYPAAITDFDRALELEPHHRNARRYKIEVLIAHGKELEKEVETVEDAKAKYRLALDLSAPEGNARAASALQRLTDNRRRPSTVVVADVIDLSDDDEGKGETTKRRVNGSGTDSNVDAEANRRKLKEMEEFIQQLKKRKSN